MRVLAQHTYAHPPSMTKNEVRKGFKIFPVQCFYGLAQMLRQGSPVRTYCRRKRAPRSR